MIPINSANLHWIKINKYSWFAVVLGIEPRAVSYISSSFFYFYFETGSCQIAKFPRLGSELWSFCLRFPDCWSCRCRKKKRFRTENCFLTWQEYYHVMSNDSQILRFMRKSAILVFSVLLCFYAGGDMPKSSFCFTRKLPDVHTFQQRYLNLNFTGRATND